jgi:hypothetical protein
MFSKQVDPVYLPAIHMGAACAGEIVSQTRWAIANPFCPLLWGTVIKECYMPEPHLFEIGLPKSYNYICILKTFNLTPTANFLTRIQK